jgi:predicted metal-dependent RNase
MLEWLRTFKNKPGATYLVHGEPAASLQLRDFMKKELGWNVQVAEYMEKVGVK